ncbi:MULTISPECIES: hypothetical protein [unclassified Streptomyces]|uniref:hypothetical protein n=1 Tax=unclassified Streptomyces TaxID=2593676 RepID=UPI000DC7C576|nr:MULTISPECIES: hypothetical protein [unclassified Streptomyces]AWZ05697.1 hypothetical protein DRB89_14715 [Streptomyces sp. ICC4]AWZ11946.1 hypothetical protein DRB96_06040 [Streptomyces sp. ICC1]
MIPVRSVLSLGVAAAAVLALASPAGAVDDVTYRFKDKVSGQCVALAPFGGAVALEDCVTADTRGQWTVSNQNDEDETVQLITRARGDGSLCLGTPRRGGNEARINQCTDDTTRWNIYEVSSSEGTGLSLVHATLYTALSSQGEGLGVGAGRILLLDLEKVQ